MSTTDLLCWLVWNFLCGAAVQWCTHNCPAAHASMDLTISMSCDTPLDTTIPTREQLGIRRNVSGHQSPTHLKHLVGEGASVHRWQLGGNFWVAMSQCLSSSLASETVAGRSGIIFISRLRGAPVLTCWLLSSLEDLPVLSLPKTMPGRQGAR